MPKIIDNLREQIQKEALHQILTEGYSKTTIRSVAKGCNIGVGTVYNYYSSKDELITSFMLDDWKKCMKKMHEVSDDDPENFLRQIHAALDEFIRKYEVVFKDEEARRVFASVLIKRHVQFRDRIAGIIIAACKNSIYPDKEFLSQHIAESIIGWTMADISFEKQYSIIKMLV